jgi:hypothetical protein
MGMVFFLLLNTTLIPQMKFIARVTSMGRDKVIIYVPKDFHKDILKNFRGKQVKEDCQGFLEILW